MEVCEIPNKQMLPPTVIHLEIDDPDCDFDCAFQAAADKVSEYDNCPVLLSWFDKKDEAIFPKGECCVEGEPTWLAFGEAQGADLTVDVNNEEFIFLFRKSHGLP